MNPAFTPVSATLATAPPAPDGSAPNPADPKAIITFRRVTSGGAPDLAPAIAAGEPKITLERDGDRITCIKIQCGCGHRIELACAY